MTKSSSGAVAVLYGWVVRAYPPDFRRQFAADMHVDFIERYLHQQTAMGRFSFAARAFADLLTSVCTQWIRQDGMRVGAAAVAAHACVWLMVLAIGTRQWPNAPDGVLLAIRLHVLAAACIIATVRVQRHRPSRTHLALRH